MDVNEPEILERGMYKATGARAVDVPEITQDNDIDAPFSNSYVGIPQDLLNEIHRPPSVDPEPEVIDQVEGLQVDAEKVTEENPQSRFRVIDTAIKLPGICALCGSAGGDGRQFIDFGKTMEWYGAVYFCTFCVREAANLIGLRATNELAVELDSYSEALQQQWTENASLQEKLNATMVLLRDHLIGNCGPVTDPLEIPEAELVESGDSIQDVEGSESSGDEHDESSIGDESDPDESAPIEGSDDVSGSSGDVESEPNPKPVRRTRKSNG